MSVHSGQHLLQHRNVVGIGNKSLQTFLQDQTGARNPKVCLDNVSAVSCLRMFSSKLDHASLGRPDPEYVVSPFD